MALPSLRFTNGSGTNDGTNETYVGVEAGNFYAPGTTGAGGPGRTEHLIPADPAKSREFYRIERVGARPYAP